MLCRYGDVVQMQHARTGHFIVAKPNAAPVDPQCLAVVLDEVSCL